MFQIDLKSRKAIYEQIVDNFKTLILSSVLKEDEKILSVRDMARELSVNPNTVQKAYRELESKGYIYTVLGQGSFVAPVSLSLRSEALLSRLYELLEEMLREGLSKAEIIEAINKKLGG